MKALTAMACLAAALTAAPGVYAAPQSVEEILRQLRSVPPPELPAVAAAVVNTAAPESRSAVATTVLQVVTQTQPASAGAVRAALVSSGVLPAPKATTVAAPVAADQSRGNGISGNGNGNNNGGPGNGNGNPPQTPNPNSRFKIAPPHGGNPPGLNGQPDRKGPPPFVDYSKPRQ
jgi:hypothetical protein